MIKDTCYVCDQRLDERHGRYPGLCVPCGDFNWMRRSETADLEGFSALVTGGRIKIGFEVTLRLLRSGASVTVTSRFTDDARRRFMEQDDFADWQDRLRLVAVDLRDLGAVQHLAATTANEGGKLDILVNNAAQTVRRPPAFYRHLLESLGDTDEGRPRALEARPSQDAGMGTGLGLPISSALALTAARDPRSVAELSQLRLIPDDEVEDPRLFPTDAFDKDGQQEDRRDRNSWTLKLDEVHLVELLEVFHVNVAAPFLLCSGLRDAMTKSAGERPSFIVNVSAMEGNFHDPDKTSRHPHTNMAKAALNMMTRTAAEDFASDRIYMNSIDTGWITNERPFPITRSHAERKVKMAIDETDGAARICDPIFRGVKDGVFVRGRLLKNYSEFPW